MFVALGVCIVLSLLVGIAEVTARSVVEARLAEASMRILHAKADVSLGGPPAVAQFATKHFPDVRMSVDDASFGQISDVDIRARLTDVRRHADEFTVIRTNVVAAADLATLEATFSNRLSRPIAVTPDPDNQVLLLRTGPAGLVQITLRPVLAGSTLRFDAQEVTVAGTPVEAPPRTDGLSDTVDLSNLPLELQAHGLVVADDGLHVDFTGGPATIPVQHR